jgi:beta-lactamase class A
VKVDEHVRAELQIAADQRAFGVLDLSDLRLALLGPDEIFYGASVPKIGIVLAYLAQDPQRALNLDPTVMRELQLVIKRSDNELAAKYSQIVGIDAIQELLQSKQYKFYDADSGGGIWCGKHYGLDVPREVDPIGGHSHAVTVRQCLRYYLMLEQGRLVNPRVCAVLKEIFAAPHLDFHTHNFIDGLRGRDVQVLRKSGSWEDWHLDTARVQNGERAYLLAGATEHPKGEEYLSRMAAEVDTLLCGKPRPPAPKHQLITYDSSSDFAGGGMSYAKPAEDGLGLVMECPPGQYESPVIETDDWFNEAVVSWNVDTPGPAGFIVELRVGRAWDDSWSPWLHVGAWGPVAPRERVTEFEAGRIDKDYFRSNERYDRIQYRIHGDSLVVDSASFEFRVNRITACVSDLSGLPLATRRAGEKGFSPERKGSLVRDSPLAPPPELVHRRLPVPFRSQKSEKPEIAGRICSPTSSSMVMEYRGVNQPTAAVAEAAYDPVHDIYGNWPANVQAAYSFGVPGYLARFTDWGEVERMIAADQPLIASIRVKEPGDLAHAPYKTTKGHLIVLCGFDADGNVEVNDPAASTPETGMLKYARADLEKVWMKAAGGLAYVLLAPSKAARVQ